MGIASLVQRAGQYGRTEDGTTAVEFSLVCIPFIYMTIAIMELCVFFASANTLEFALSSSARMIRTGQLQASGAADIQAAFKTELCSHLLGLIDCDKIGLEAITMPDGKFTTASSNGVQYNPDGTFKSQGFDPGGEGSVVLIRVYYKYYMMTPLFSRLFSTQPDQSTPLISAIVIQNEPYSPNT